MLYSTKTDKFLMGFQLKLLGLWLFLVLNLSLCHGNNVTFKVVGVMHCTDCIKNQTTSNIISIHCKSKNQETKTQSNGSIDKEGNFNVTLSADITNDEKSIDSCFAKLQSTSPDPCPIQSAQTASVKLISIEENATQSQNKPTVIKFSPVTCQSAFFWPFINITISPFLSPPQQPPAVYSPPPSEALTPLSPPVQPPVPPEVDPTPRPAPAPELPYLGPVSPSVLPTPPPTSPPPEAFHQTPSVAPTPILPLTPPAPVSVPATPRELENPISSPPNGRKPSPIPRAPPVPKLPPFPTVPRKYFNSPKSRSQPPRSSYPAHS